MNNITERTMLTDKQVLKIAGSKTKLIVYPNLKRYKSLKQLFGKHKKIIILYVHDEDKNSITGHWCALIKHPHYTEFFDSYGMMPDDLIMMKTNKDRKNTKQEHNYLSNLLYNSEEVIEYNEYPYQDVSDGINTCGEHTAIRCRFSDIPLKQYQNIFNLFFIYIIIL